MQQHTDSAKGLSCVTRVYIRWLSGTRYGATATAAQGESRRIKRAAHHVLELREVHASSIITACTHVQAICDNIARKSKSCYLGYPLHFLPIVVIGMLSTERNVTPSLDDGSHLFRECRDTIGLQRHTIKFSGWNIGGQACAVFSN